jgi:hypothetical protein
MDDAVLWVIGIAMALLLLGACVAASEREQQRRTQDRGDAYRLRSGSIRVPPPSSPPK